LTPLSKFVPDVAPVPDSSTNPTIRTGACCARDGSAALIIQIATEKQKALFMNSSIQQRAFLILREQPRHRVAVFRRVSGEQDDFSDDRRSSCHSSAKTAPQRQASADRSTRRCVC
jgi:hypothetical protein